jgi:hypothetical protein
LTGQFTDNGKPASAYISYISFGFYKNCLCTSDMGNNGQKNVALEEWSISEIMYAYSHTPNFVHPTSEIVEVCSASVFRFLSGCIFICLFSLPINFI